MYELEKIVRKAASNPKYFEKLYRLTVDRAMRYFISKTGSSADAEDLTQELYIRLYRALPEYKEEGNFLSFFYAIAKSVYIDWLRKNSSERNNLPLTDNLKTTGSNLEKHELKNEIIGYVRKLSEIDQEIIILYFLEGHSNAEIAKILGLTEENVRVRKFRALRALNRMIKDDGYAG